MRFLNRPQIEENDNTQQAFLDTVNNVFGVRGELSLYKTGDFNTQTYLKASTSLSSNYTLTLPPNSGVDGQVLTTDGNGTLRFTNPDVGGNRIFVSAKNGDDANDGFNKPVRSIKRAAQIAASFSEPIVDPGQGAWDSKALLLANKTFIKNEVIAFINYSVTYGVYPFTTNFTYNQATCARDIGYIIDSVIYDLTFGGNAQSRYAGSSYYSATASVVISNQKAQSIRSMEYAKYVCAAVLNQTALAPTSGGNFNNAPYYSSGGQVYDNTKTPTSPNKTKIADGFDLIISILDNGLTWRDSNIVIVNPVYKPLPVTIQIAAGEYYEDNPIITPDKSTIVGDDLRSVIIRPMNPGKDMFRVRNGMYMTGFTFRDALNENPVSADYGKPVSTFGYAIAFDDVEDYSVNRAAYVGLAPNKPVITLSPYIQNCSVISFLGGNGVIADGSKVASPNVPRISEEVEAPPVGAIPSQKPSVIANAFTMVSFGGTGWKIINDAYAQLVSCFQLFMLNGVYAGSGGYVSITNSATNFGINALRSSGYSPVTYSFDKGIIADIGSDNQLQTITSLGHGRVPVNHYVIKFKNSILEDITGNYKSVTPIELSINPSTDINPVNNQISYTAHGLVNGSSVLYSNEGHTDIIGLTSGDIYYVYREDANHISLYYDSSLTRKVILDVGASYTHKLIQNVEEFYVNEIPTYHNTYQKLTLGSDSHTFTPGKRIYGTVSGTVNSAYVYSWNATSRELVVSLINVSNGGGLSKVPFTDVSSITSDDGASINISVTAVESITDLFTATYTVRSTLDQSIINTNTLQSKYIWLNKPSIVNSSSHTWEYAGSGIDYNALPDNGGKTIVALQQVAELPGRVYTSGTNELGDFTVGNFITAYNRTGNIVFSNKVTVSELTALKLSLSDISITAISTDIGLGDNEQGGASNTRLTTQLAQRSFLANRLGDFIDKHISTSSIPAAIVQLNGNGQINADLIPPIRGFNTHLINSYNGRLSLYESIPVEEVLAGDVISETYTERLLTLSGTVNLSAGTVITQANSNATGTVKTTTATNLVVLVLITGTFNTSDNLSAGSSLGVYPTNVAAQNTNSDSYYLTTDNTSQFLRLSTTGNYRFTVGNQVRAAVNGAVGNVSDYRSGYVTGLGTLVGGTLYTPSSSSTTYYNVPLTGGTGKYTSAAGATSSTTTITVTSTTNLEIGMLVTVTTGTGAFVAGTTVTNISSATQFTVSQTPSTPLSGGSTVIRGDATGARADISVSSGSVTSVNIYRGGVGYQVGDILSASSANIGSTGSGFTITVSSIEKRLYVDITNSLRFTATSINYNYIQDNNAEIFSLTLDDTLVKSFNAGSSSGGGGGNVDYINNYIIFPSNHNLSDGDPVNYSPGIEDKIGNFEINDTYYVGVINPTTIELYVDYAKVSKKLFGTSSSGTHTLTRSAIDIHSNHLVKLNHGLVKGQAVKISNFDNTAPEAVIDGIPTNVPDNSYWFVGSVTVNSFTLHQYSVDAISSFLGATNNEVNFTNTGEGTATFTVQNATVISVVNTSSKTVANYSSLSNTTIDAGGIISGTINTTRLGSQTANSTNYLRGDSLWHTVTESISKGPNSPISLSGNYVSDPILVTGLSGTITSTATTTTITGISSTSQLFTGMVLTKTGGGGGFGGTATIDAIINNTSIAIHTDNTNVAGTVSFTASSTVNKYYGDTAIDIIRVDNTLPGTGGTYTNTGIASYDTTYFAVGPDAVVGTVSGQISIKQNVIDAASVNGKNSTYLLTPTNLLSLVPISKGGTNLNAYSAGDILYASAQDTLNKLAVGTVGKVLSSTGTYPTWVGYTGSSSSNIVYSENPTITIGLTAGTTTFNLATTTATTVNFASAAETALNIGYLGSSASTTNISTGPVKSSTIKTVNVGTGAVAGSTTNINIGSGIGGTTTINSGTVVGANTTQNLYNTTATTMNFAGAATTIGIGAATGTITLGNQIVTGTNLATFNMNGTSPIAIVTSTASSTANVFNTNATTGNLFGAATAVTIGATTGTLTVNNVTISYPNATSMSMDGISPSITTASIGTASVFNTNATIGNLLGAAPYVNIGKSSIASELTFDGSATTGWSGNTPTASAAQGNPINSLLANATTAYRSTAFTTLVGRTIQFDAYLSSTSSMDFYFGTNVSGSGNVLELNSGTGASDLSTCSSYSRGGVTINNTTNQFTSGSWVTVTIAITSTSAAGIAIYWGSTAKTFTRNQFVSTGDYIGFQNVSGTCYIDNIKIYNGVYTPDQITAGAILTTNAGSVVGANTTQNLYNTVATTVNAFGAATSLSLGYTSTAASTTNISTGAVASGITKTINIGTGGASGSTTNVNIGSSNSGTITIAPTITLGSSLIATVTTTSITNTPAVVIDSWSLTTYRSAKYILQVTCTASTGSNINTYQVSEVLVIHNGTTASMIEYSVIKTTNDLATFTIDCNSSSNGLVRILAAANSGDTITVKLYKTLVTV